MKAFKPRAGARPSPAEALAAAAEAAPQHPPAVQQAGVNDNATATLNLRVKMGTIRGLAAAAKKDDLTQKQVLMRALKAAGVAVAPADLENRTPRRHP